MKIFTAYDIDWDVDINEIYEAFEKMTIYDAAKELCITADTYADMKTVDRHEIIRDKLHHNRINAAEILGLPDEVKIPGFFGLKSEKDDTEEVTDWLSDVYGYCINNYKVKYS